MPSRSFHFISHSIPFHHFGFVAAIRLNSNWIASMRWFVTRYVNQQCSCCTHIQNAFFVRAECPTRRRKTRKNRLGNWTKRSGKQRIYLFFSLRLALSIVGQKEKRFDCDIIRIAAEKLAENRNFLFWSLCVEVKGNKYQSLLGRFTVSCALSVQCSLRIICVVRIRICACFLPFSSWRFVGRLAVCLWLWVAMQCRKGYDGRSKIASTRSRRSMGSGNLAQLQIFLDFATLNSQFQWRLCV